MIRKKNLESLTTSMTEDEKKARKILDLLTANIPVPFMDFVMQIKLTDEECKSMAVNYPYSFRSIRNSFGRK